MDIKDTLVMNIRRLRKEKGLTQAQFAELIQVSHSHIRQFETGQTRLSLELIESIAKALELPSYVLFETEEDAKKINLWRSSHWEKVSGKFVKLDMDLDDKAVKDLRGSSLLSLLVNRFSVIPDDVLEMAQKFSLDHKVWEYIRGFMEAASKENNLMASIKIKDTKHIG